MNSPKIYKTEHESQVKIYISTVDIFRNQLASSTRVRENPEYLSVVG